MKAHWVALVAAAALVVGLGTGGLVGFALGLWTGQGAAEAGRSADGAGPQAARAASPTPEPLPHLELEVFADGCGVIRSEAPPGIDYPLLTWVFRDEDGFQVLGRAAETETRYRYFQPGRYSVVLEAQNGGGYQVVSNEVTVTC